MATTNKSLVQQAYNTQSGTLPDSTAYSTWDVPINYDYGVIDSALGSNTNITINGSSASRSLTLAEYQPMFISFIGTVAPTGNLTFTIPVGVGGSWLVYNKATLGGYTISIATATAGVTTASVVIPAGGPYIVTCVAVSGATGMSFTQVGGISSVYGLQTALDALQASIDMKAPIASPTLTGTPLAPTAAAYTNTTQIATTAEVYNTVTTVPTNFQNTTGYTLALTDVGKALLLYNTGGINLTIPVNSSVAFPMYTRIDIIQYGPGQITVGGAGVTIRSYTSKVATAGPYAGATLLKINTDEWVLIGNLA